MNAGGNPTVTSTRRSTPTLSSTTNGRWSLINVLTRSVERSSSVRSGARLVAVLITSINPSSPHAYVVLGPHAGRESVGPEQCLPAVQPDRAARASELVLGPQTRGVNREELEIPQDLTPGPGRGVVLDEVCQACPGVCMEAWLVAQGVEEVVTR